jgi:predicted aspartyl protease
VFCRVVICGGGPGLVHLAKGLLVDCLSWLNLFELIRREDHSVRRSAMNDRGESAMDRVTVEVELVNQGDLFLAGAGKLAPDKVRRLKMPGVVDTGATYLVIPKDTAKRLGVPDAGKAKVRYADRRSATRQMVELVTVQLLGRKGTFRRLWSPVATPPSSAPSSWKI